MSYLYKIVKKGKLNELYRTGKLTLGKIASFTDNVSHKHADFGTVLLKVKKSSICKKYECLKIQYTLSWFERYPDIFKYVTWEDFDDTIRFIENSIKTYGDYEGKKTLSEAFKRYLYYKRYVLEAEIVVRSKRLLITINKNDIVNVKEYTDDFLPTW